MFNNKKDPLVESIKLVMQKSALRNKVEEALNEQLGVSSRKAIPHEYLAQYDAILAEQYAKAEGPKEAPTKGDKAEAASLEGKKDLPNPIAHRLMKQGSYTPAARGKEKLQEKLDPVGEEDRDIDNDGEENTNSDKYLKHRREVISKKMDKQQLQEKATEKQKEKVARVMREYKKGKLHSGSKEGPKVTDRKQAVAIALSQAGLSKKMDESLQSLQEEIRNSLTEKLNYIYENYGQGAAQYAYDQLTEQEKGILSEGILDWLFRRPSTPTAPPATAPATAATPAPAGAPAAPAAPAGATGGAPAAPPPAAAERPATAPWWARSSQKYSFSAQKAKAADNADMGRDFGGDIRTRSTPSAAQGARAAAENVPGEGRKPAAAPTTPPASAARPAASARRPSGNAGRQSPISKPSAQSTDREWNVALGKDPTRSQSSSTYFGSNSGG